jgi:hypothetical protein
MKPREFRSKLSKKERKDIKDKDLQFRLRHHYTRNVPTPDDWYPAHIDKAGGWFAEGTVFLEKKHPGGWVRVCFWGDDDFGIEKDMFFDTLDEALECYHREVRWLSRLAMASWRDLLKIGFIHA